MTKIILEVELDEYDLAQSIVNAPYDVKKKFLENLFYLIKDNGLIVSSIHNHEIVFDALASDEEFVYDIFINNSDRINKWLEEKESEWL